MQKQSKIKSVTPRIEGGNHHTYIMGDRTFYEYIVEMENGDKGRAASTQDTFRYSVGEEVLYEQVLDEKHGDRLKSFAAVEQKQEEKTIEQRPDRYKEDPGKTGFIVAQSSISTAATFMALLKEEHRTSDNLWDLAAKIEKWVYDNKKRHS